MKIFFCTALAFVFLTFNPPGGECQENAPRFEQFAAEYEELKPKPFSSVGSDYKSEQTALGIFYLNRTLSMIYDQNQSVGSRLDALSQKETKLIEQNEKIIQLLSIIAKQTDSSNK